MSHACHKPWRRSAGICGSGEERGAGQAAFVVVDLTEREPAVGIDRGVHIAHAPAPSLLTDADLRAASDPPPAPVEDAAQLLHIHGHQLPGPVGVDPADHPPGGRSIHAKRFMPAQVRKGAGGPVAGIGEGLPSCLPGEVAGAARDSSLADA